MWCCRYESINSFRPFLCRTYILLRRDLNKPIDAVTPLCGNAPVFSLITRNELKGSEPRPFHDNVLNHKCPDSFFVITLIYAT